ncbi:hypothetical protein MTO96_043320, partial [Rhipicephalus appendiculatus]
GQHQQPGSRPGSTQARDQGRRRKWRRGIAAAGSGFSAARLNVVAKDPPIFDMWNTGLISSSVPPYMLTVEVCGHPIPMELDTGASVPVMAGNLCTITFPGVAVEAPGGCHQSYSAEIGLAHWVFGCQKSRKQPYTSYKSSRDFQQIPSHSSSQERTHSLAGLPRAPRNVEAGLKAPKPRNKNELQSCLGRINFYRRFLPNLSTQLQPLHILLRDEHRYSQLDKEGLAFMFGVECFHWYLWGRKFEAVTDQKPLLELLGPYKMVLVQASPRWYDGR